MIKPVVLGKRIEFLRTDNPYADLKPGGWPGTVVDRILNCRMKDKPSDVWVLWDSDRDLQSWMDYDDYRTVYD